MQRSITRKVFIRLTIVLLGGIIWCLGRIEESHWFDAPDKHFAAGIVIHKGWRVIFQQLRSPKLGGEYFVYIMDKRTGERHLAASHPEFCVFSYTTFARIKWQDNRRFTCSWDVQYNGSHAHRFKIQTNPLRVQGGSSCCGTT